MEGTKRLLLYGKPWRRWTEDTEGWCGRNVFAVRRIVATVVVELPATAIPQYVGRRKRHGSEQETLLSLMHLECCELTAGCSKHVCSLIQYNTTKFLTCPTCQFASESEALRRCQKQLRVARFKQASS